MVKSYIKHTKFFKVLKKCLSVSIILLTSSCILKGKIIVDSTTKNLPGVVFTSPLLDTISKTSSIAFTWIPIDPDVRLTNSYEVKTYTQASCSGGSNTAFFVNSPNYTLTNIKDRIVYSISVSSFTSANKQTAEVCSSAITGDAIISKLQLPSGLHLSIEVDHVEKMAYTGVELAGTGFRGIDFSDETAPVLFRTMGSATTPSSAIHSSRGVALYNNGERLLVTGSLSSSLELWDLTSNPRNAWVKLGTLNSLSSVRKIAKVDTTDPSNTVVTLALRSGIAIVNIAEPAGTMTILRSSTGYSNGHGAGAVMGNWMISPNANSSGPLDLINLTTLASDAQYPFPSTIGGANMWSAAANATGTKGFSSGLIAGFFSYDPATPGVFPVNTERVYTSSPTYSRDAVFTTEFGKELVYVALGGGLGLDVWDATDIANPTLLNHISLTGATGEAYGVRVDPINHRAYVVTNGGQFFIINTEMMAPTPMTFITF